MLTRSLAWIVCSLTSVALASDHTQDLSHGNDNHDLDRNAFQKRSDHVLRELVSTRACGEVIGTTSREDITKIGEFFIDQALGLANLTSFIPTAVGVLLPSVDYDIRAVKVCGSCEDYVSRLMELSDTSKSNDYGYYTSYCDSSNYGYSSPQSALVFYPVDNSTNKIPSGKLRTLVDLHRQLFDTRNAPSEKWPADPLATLRTLEANNPVTALTYFVDFMQGMLPAATGAITVFPDYAGFGSTSPGTGTTLNRTDFLQTSYMQASSVTFLAASDYLTNLTGNCSILDNVTTVSGASEGGYAAASVALALQHLGQRIKQIFMAAPFLDLQVQLKFIVDSYNQSLVNPSDIAVYNGLFQASVPSLLFAGSADTPGYANTNNQTLMADIFLPNATSWFADDLTVAELLPRVPFPSTVMLDPSLSALFHAAGPNVDRPCGRAGEDPPTSPHLAGTAANCEMLKQSSVLNLMADTAVFDIDTAICYSVNDTFATLANYTGELAGNTKIVVSDKLLGGVLTVDGDHISALLLCAIPVAANFAVENPADVDRPNKITSLSPDELNGCTSDNTTSAAPTFGFGWSILPTALLLLFSVLGV